MTGLRFGLKTYDAAPWDELRHRWRDHEAAGFDALWAGDHVWSTRDGDGAPARPRFDSWLMAAGIAAVTSRVDVGTLVSPIGLRNPAVLGKQAVTLDHLSGGRAVAGIGSGGNPLDGAAAGIPAWPSDEKAARLGEYARIVRSYLRGADVDVDGEFYRSHGVSAPAPVRGRLLIAAHTRASIAAAAAHADVWNSYGVLFSQLRAGVVLTPEQSLAATRRRARWLDEECERIGRDPAEITRSFMLAFTRDTPWTSVQNFRDTIGRYADIGITEFMFPFPLQGEHDDDVFAEVVADVMPRLQAGERP
ncbi:LLM class flavin-dependent oxidoreductase [Actinoplanes couchii]|uniref:Luciferase n=1 Tax=Actinoplanes couchii TaxID=403638 RepID=A0ABQ3X8E1_9ACTN|nr:LLM class flavin-dependent oxidoreductase [Actinoplanes couchii]MDR6320215.1 alkanesulfonate monooxygenase SsuD/methylene tetrahydromethanopterin reductase-like flavin-dependent oxidoreductase (luciferase family) [Actinoplanes couchii]GID54770.1 luciferase [Actinoplanes couchii]